MLHKINSMLTRYINNYIVYTMYNEYKLYN